MSDNGVVYASSSSYVDSRYEILTHDLGLDDWVYGRHLNPTYDPPLEHSHDIQLLWTPSGECPQCHVTEGGYHLACCPHAQEVLEHSLQDTEEMKNHLNAYDPFESERLE